MHHCIALSGEPDGGLEQRGTVCSTQEQVTTDMTLHSSCGIVLHLQMSLVIIGCVSASCKSASVKHSIIECDTALSVFSALRVFALFDHNRLLFALVLLSGLLNPAILIVSPSLPSTVSCQLNRAYVAPVYIHQIRSLVRERDPRMLAQYSGQFPVLREVSITATSPRTSFL